MRQRLGLLVACVAVLALALWHARPVLIWHLTVAPQLRALPHASRLEVSTYEASPDAPAEWTLLQAGGLALRAPIAPGQARDCARCAERCWLELMPGRLAILDSSLPESLDAALAQFAPDADDISIFRVASENWRTLEALAARVNTPNALPATFRYRSASSEGVVTRFESEGSERFVIYAFARNGAPGRVVALSRTGVPVMQQLLGSIEIDDTLRPSRCSQPSENP